jgi:hypothetical protein
MDPEFPVLLCPCENGTKHVEGSRERVSLDGAMGWLDVREESSSSQRRILIFV